MNYISDITDKIIKIAKTKRTVFIGIDGLGGSGKSTLADRLSKAVLQKNYKVVTLHLDDFIHEKAVRYNSDYPKWKCYYDIQWRYDYIVNNIILPIKQNNNFVSTIELYDKDSDSYCKQKIATDSNTIVIVEGVFLQRKELQKLFDFVIYIDVPEPVRLQRVLKRDTYIGNSEEILKKYHNRYFPAEHRYIEEYSPNQTADYVITHSMNQD